MPHLIELLRGVDAAYDAKHENLEITHVTANSREVRPGSLFVAIPGVKADGAQFINMAVEKGASAVLCHPGAGWDPHLPALQAETSIPACAGMTIPWITTPNPRLALARIAANFYPRQPAHIAAVTGTDGKTSTAEFTRQLWEMLGHKAASIGTLGIKGEGGEELYPGTHTTPDPLTLHRILQGLSDRGYTHLVMEASSHGLDQHRLDGVRLQAAAFTNLTRDHLDYHGDEESYFRAKARLFLELLPEGGAAVINVDDARTDALEAIALENRHRYIAYGKTRAFYSDPWEEQHFFINRFIPQPHGQQFSFAAWKTVTSSLKTLFANRIETEYGVDVPLVGAFQAFNILAACGLVWGCGETDIEVLVKLLPNLKGVPGRLEQVAAHPSGAPVFIDYAHTPTALAGILKTLRPHTRNRLVVVFGCGGDRDKGKRPLMGKAAAEFADVVFVTDDNPRSEDPAQIRTEVMAGCPDATSVAGRESAIYAALSTLEQGDVLVVAGKGHEKTQTIGDQAIPFDDAEVIREWGKNEKR